MAASMRLSCILLVSTLAIVATREPPPAAGMYSLSQMQDYLIHISGNGNGTNKTIGKVDLWRQFNPIGPQLSSHHLGGDGNDVRAGTEQNRRC